MNILITPGEVLEMAFASPEGAESGHISESVIVSAQRKFIRPVINGLFDKLEQGEYEPLLTGYIKPPLAYYVKFLVLPMLSAHVGSLGVVQSRGATFLPADAATLAALRRQTRSDANALMRIAVEHIEVNRTAYPEYDPARNILHRASIASQVVL